MHSKLVKLQTTLMMLALLFTVLLPVPARALDSAADPQAATEYDAISDPNTFNAWEYTQGYNDATTGRIWADKTVEEDKIEFTGPLRQETPIAVPQGADFLVALSALSSHASTTSTETKSLDVVMVLDVSGSMDDAMGRTDSTRRIVALREAANDFIEKAKNENAKITDADKKINIAIVKFAGDKTERVGNDTYQSSGYAYNNSQIVRNLTLCDDTGAATLKNNVNGLKPAGATRSDYGMQLAQKVLNDDPRENANKVVIFFTDGKPTSFSDFDPSVASAAVTAAGEIKKSGAEIYTVGIFDGADPSASISNNRTSNENKFMHAVSSNYPNATYTQDRRGNYSFTWGTAAAEPNYYLAAASADGLKEVFDSIFESVTTRLPGPTEVTGDPAKDGYVTFDDPLGDYMEVQNFEAVAFADGVYKNVQKTTNGNVDTYVFTDTIPDTVSNAYPKNAKLQDIIITVTRSRNRRTGDKVQVKIPASMLPLRYYEVTTVDDRPTLKVSDTYPINVIYSVRLKENVRSEVLSGTSSDAELARYVAQDAADGRVDFYSNLYSGARKTADGQYTVGQTTATFTPAESNSFYYHTKNAPLYDENGQAITHFEQGKTYYYKLTYCQLDPNDRTKTLTETRDVPMHIDEAEAIDRCIGRDETTGQCYIKKGTLKGSLPTAIDDQLGLKSDNTTGTADRRIDFQWNLSTNMGVLYLGNNGKLSFDAKGSVRVTKVVESAAGLHPNADTDFTMKFTLTAKEGTTLDAAAGYKYTVTDAAGAEQRTGTIKSSDTFTLKADETAEIEGLPVGSTYTITEENLPTGYTQKSISDGGTGTVEAGRVKGTSPLVTVTNTYEPEEITVEPADADFPFLGEKTLTGRDWLGSDQFTFRMEAVSPADAPMPEGAGWVDGKHIVQLQMTQSEGTPADTPVPFHFGAVTYSKPGTYVYNITESIPTDEKIPGVSYDSAFYRVTVVIEDDGSGQLKMTSHSMEKVTANAPGNDPAASASFVNTFKDDTETLNMEARKIYEDESGNRMQLTKGQFNFKLEAAKENESGELLPDNANIPMPTPATAANNANGQITFADITYTLEKDDNKTCYYLLTEEPGVQNNITYSDEKYLIKVDVSDAGTETEPLRVTSAYYKWNSETSRWMPVTADGVTFTNTFTGEAKAVLGVSKSISGRDWKPDDEFTFTLSGENDSTPMPAADGRTAAATADNTAPDFGEIIYKKAGTYRYTIKETGSPAAGMHNAPDVTATVTVALNADTNQLEASVAYSVTDTENGKAEFVNTYNTTPYEAYTKDLFKVKKVLTGRDWNDTDTFTFTLSGVGDAPMPDESRRTAAVSRTNQTASFGGNDPLEFTAPGEYVY